MTRRGFLSCTGAALVGGAGALLLDSRDKLTVEHRTLRLPRWTVGTIKIVVMADFHIDLPESIHRMQRACELAAAEKPDLVLLPGDFTQSSLRDVVPPLRRALDAIESFACPVFATLGNHDYWAKDPSSVIKTIANSRLTLLRNQASWFEGVGIYGVDDGLNGRSRFDFCAAMPSNSLVAFHEPDYVKHLPVGASLMVAGHSHGGQMCLPGGIPLYSPAGARRYISGFYADAITPLYVTRGVGTIGHPRYFCPPEISVLTLTG